MLLKPLILSVGTLVLGLATYVLAVCQKDEKAPTVIHQSYQGLQVEYLHNSATMSQALGMNVSGSIFGVRERLGHRQGNFFWGKDGMQEMPLPEGFTNVEPLAISDTDLVVGRTMKAIGSGGSLQGVVWSPSRGEIKRLPPPPGDTLCDAHDITADGKRITGYATGSERLRPVVWEWDDAQSAWQVEVLPTEYENNPYLMSSQLIISPDGSTIVGCGTERLLPDGSIDSALFEWRKVEGKWSRRLVTKEQMYVKSINNKGQIAGSVPGEYGRLPCLVTLAGELKLLDPLQGDVAGEARDINDDSVIVGWSDNPTNPDGGPRPCTWNVEGKATPVKLSKIGYGMLFAINSRGQMAGTAEIVIKPATSKAPDEEESAMLAVRVSKEQKNTR